MRSFSKYPDTTQGSVVARWSITRATELEHTFLISRYLRVGCIEVSLVRLVHQPWDESLNIYCGHIKTHVAHILLTEKFISGRLVRALAAETAQNYQSSYS